MAKHLDPVRDPETPTPMAYGDMMIRRLFFVLALLAIMCALVALVFTMIGVQ